MAGPKPTPETGFDAFFSFYAELQKETDRAAVILGAAKLDQLLLEILKRFLRPSPNSKDDLLEEGDAPLGTYGARIRLVHRLGLIDDAFAKALNLTKRLRNDFAHDMTASLAAGGHATRVKEVAALFQDLAPYHQLVQLGGQFSRPSAELRAAFAILAMRLEGCFDGIRTIAATAPFPLLPPAPKVG